MAYQAPGIRLRQRLTSTSSPSFNQQYAHVSGGHAYLVRYAEASEKELGRLGFYDHVTDQEYAWPHLPAGSRVDLSYTKLFIENALLRYFYDTIGSGNEIRTVAGSRNRIRCETLAFKANGASYPRSDVFLSRDVQVGDVVKLRAVVDSEVYELWTYVRALEADPVPSIVRSAEVDSNNAPSQAAPTPTWSQTAGPENCVAIDSVNQTNYNGLLTGRINEVYTIEVIASSSQGDATTARLRVTSASGLDNQPSVAPAPFGSPTPIGTLGLQVTWDLLNTVSCSMSADDAEVAHDDFIVGQKWVVSCGQAFTATTATSGGTFIGRVDETYIVEVTRGGRFSSSLKPQITVTTARGTDRSGPTNVPGLSVAVPVGTQGVTISFGASTVGLRKGDRFIIRTVAQTSGYYRQILLGHNLPDEVYENGSTEIDLSLFIRKSFEIPKNRLGFAPLTNWNQDQSKFYVRAALQAYDSSWHDDGEELPLPVYSEPTKRYGELFVEYRAWRNEHAQSVLEINSLEELDTAVSGPVHPDNPFKFGLYCALLNSNGAPVKGTSVAEPDNPDSWTRVLSLLDGRRDVYALAPLTFNDLVKSLFIAHVNSQSAENKCRFRELFLAQPQIRSRSIVDSSVSDNGDEVLATIADDPSLPGLQHTFVTASNVNFLTIGVRAGDQLRTQYTTDGFGNIIYNTYEVLEVINENTLRLVTGPASPLSTPQKIEIWRTQSAEQEVQSLIAANTYSNRRVINILPGRVVISGYDTEGYFLSACVAGLASGVEQHRPLTNMPLQGVNSTPDTNRRFTAEQLDSLAESGYWIVWYDRELAAVVNRHALTTASLNNLNEGLEAKTRNLDAISYGIMDILRPYIGRANLTESLRSQIETQLNGYGTDLLNGASYPADIGPRVLTWEILELRQDLMQRNRLLVTVAVTEPTELDYITATIISL